MDENYLGKLNSGFTTPISSVPGSAQRLIHESVMFRRSQMNAIYPLLKESFWPRSVPDISWDYERPEWGAFGFLSLQRTASAGQTVWIKAFQAKGHNNTGGPVTNVSGLFRSDINNREVPMNFRISSNELVKPGDTYGIPMDADLFIESDRLSPTDSRGLTREEFLAMFGAFTLELNYDGKKYVRHFTRDESERLISKFVADLDRRSPKPLPMVTKKN